MDPEFMGNPPDAEEQLDKIAADMIPLVRRPAGRGGTVRSFPCFR